MSMDQSSLLISVGLSCKIVSTWYNQLCSVSPNVNNNSENSDGQKNNDTKMWYKYRSATVDVFS